MNDIQSVIDRQLGIHSRFNYDNVLKRFVVHSDESYYGLQNTALPSSFDQDPPIFACRFSEASGYEHILALANEDGRVAIQDTSTMTTAKTLNGFPCHKNAVFDLAWMPKHMNFVTVSGDHTACLWDVSEASARHILMFSYHTRSVKTAAFRPGDPAVFATGARDGHVLVWDVRGVPQPAVLLRPDNCLTSCHASCAPAAPAAPATPRAGKRARPDARRAVSITGLAFQDDRTLLSCGECDGIIKVWDLRKNYSVYRREPLPKHSIPYCGSSTKNGYTNLVVDDAGVRLYASCMDNVIYCFNISTYNALPERRYVGHENSTFYIKTCLSPDGAYLVSGSSDKHAYVWNVKCSEPLVRLAGHWAEVTCAAWCRRGAPKLVTCSDDARHKIWRIGREGPGDPAELQGRAEPAPRGDAAPPPLWGPLDRTPKSLKRKVTTTPCSRSTKRARADSHSGRKTKRCLTALMNASKDDETSAKRQKMDIIPEDEEPKLLPAGSKRHLDEAERPEPRPPRWVRAGPSCPTPDEDYERNNCKLLSPKSPKTISSTSGNESPVRVSPTKVRIVSFETPTIDLPNFVLDGEAPHLRLMSPVKKKQDTTDWLTLMVRERKGKSEDRSVPVPSPSPCPSPASPREGAPARRSSVTDKTPKANRNRTLHKYFNVASKEK